MQVSGNQELIFLKTPVFMLQISGKKELVLSKPTYQVTYRFICHVDSTLNQLLISDVPVLFEATSYDMSIDIQAEYYNDFRVEHEYPSLIKNLKRHPKHPYYHAQINFKNAIGLSDFEFYLGELHYGTLTVEVFPTKLNYQEDYYAMLKDIEDELYNLMFDYLKQTYLAVTDVHTPNQSLSEYLSIVDAIINDYVKAFKYIEKHPHHKVITEVELKPYHKIKGHSKATQKWMQKHSQDCRVLHDNILPVKAQSQVKHTTYNTYENQFVKQSVSMIITKLTRMQMSLVNGLTESKRKNAIESRIHSYKLRLNGLLRSPFLSEVATYTPKESNSLVFAKGQGYKHLFKFHHLLLRGLSLESDILKMSMKDIAELYEYWCFIAINKILRKHYMLISADHIKFDHTGLNVTLKKGNSSTLRYYNRKSGTHFEVHYNKTFKGLVNQRPDHVISIKKKNPDLDYFFIFDAKYKIENAVEGSSYHNRYGMQGPKEEDINTMHRYRDAVYYQNYDKVSSPEKLAYGAYVLFPYDNEEAFKSHAFYKSISKYNVGAFPMLPSQHSLFEKFLIGIIEEDSWASYTRKLDYYGINEVLSKHWLNPRNVLCGVVRNRLQRDLALEHGLYHMPYNTFIKNKGVGCVEEIAMMQTVSAFGNESGIHYFGKVVGYEIVKRRDIKLFPMREDHDYGEENYVLFRVNEWIEKDKPIQVESINKQEDYWFMTTLYLLNEGYTYEDLKIESFDVLALWKELVRIGVLREQGIVSVINHESFELQQCMIDVNEKDIRVYRESKLLGCITLDEFIDSRMAALNKIHRLMS